MVKAHGATKFVAVDTGYIVARVGLAITFFMSDWRGHEPGIVRAYERVRPQLEASVSWYRTGAMRQMRKRGKGTLGAPLVLENEPPPGGTYSLTLMSGKTDCDVGPVTFYLSLSGTNDPDASVFHLALPLDWADNPDDFRQLFLDLAALLPFRSGLAGYATQVDEGAVSPPADRACGEWLRQYQGIDSMHAVVVTEFVKNKVKGVNWLTAVDKACLQRIGKPEKLRRQLPPDVSMYSIGEGVVMQAGPEPLLLDRDQDASLYAAVDNAIRRVRLTRRVVLPGFCDEPATRQWLARFEARNA